MNKSLAYNLKRVELFLPNIIQTLLLVHENCGDTTTPNTTTVGSGWAEILKTFEGGQYQRRMKSFGVAELYSVTLVVETA